MKRVAIITGSTGGIGHSICEFLHEDGVEIHGIVRHKDKPVPWQEYVCDLSKTEEINSCLNEIYAKCDEFPNILINNAGIYHAKSWEDMSSDEFIEAININTVAPFIISKYWVHALIEAGKSGDCVNISSISGMVGSVDTAYASSKAGLIMMTKNMAKSLAKNNIRMNTIAPGPVKTKMADKIPTENQKQYKDKSPMGRFGEVEEISSVVRFLLSNDSSYMTGSVLTVDGGLV